MLKTVLIDLSMLCGVPSRCRGSNIQVIATGSLSKNRLKADAQADFICHVYANRDMSDGVRDCRVFTKIGGERVGR